MLEKYMFTKVNLFLEGSLDGEIKSAIKSRAILGAIALAIPLPAISTIAYVLILWNTYSKIAEISTVPFRDHLWSNISGAVVINILIGIHLSDNQNTYISERCRNRHNYNRCFCKIWDIQKRIAGKRNNLLC